MLRSSGPRKKYNEVSLWTNPGVQEGFIKPNRRQLMWLAGVVILFAAHQTAAFLFYLAGPDDVSARSSLVLSDDFSFGTGDRAGIVDGDYMNDLPVQVGDTNWYTRGGGGAAMVFRSSGKMGVRNNQGNAGAFIPYDFDGIDTTVRMKASFVAGNQMFYGGSVNGAYLSFNGNSASLVREGDDINQITLRFSPVQDNLAATVMKLYCNETGTEDLPDVLLSSDTFPDYAFSDAIELTLEWAPASGAVRAIAKNTNTGLSRMLTASLDPAVFAGSKFNTLSVQTTGMDSSSTYTDTVFDDFEVRVLDPNSVNVVEDYGAVPDDGLDDTQAIQAALDDLSDRFNIGSSDSQMAGVALFLPEGVYDISNCLEFAANNPPARWGGIMIHGDGRTRTVIRSRNTDPEKPDGALYFEVDISDGETGIQIEDIGFQAVEADAGPAVRVESPTGELPRIRVGLRNVDIGRTALGNCYTYGFKGSDLMRPLFDDVHFEGIKGISVCGIYMEDSYAHDIKDCSISGADTGIHHHYRGGEGNHINRVDISDVGTGVYVEMEPYTGVYMSNANGKLLNSTISAGEYGVRFRYKTDVYISGNTFLSEAGDNAYRDVELAMCRSSFIAGNSFAGAGVNRTGIVLRVDVPNIDAKQTVVSDNTFGSFNTGIHVGATVEETMILNNSFGTVTNILDSGESTLIVDGTPDPFVSLARAKDSEEFEWGVSQGTVFNVKTYGAAGNGVADDTEAVQSAAAALKTFLNGGNRSAVLYFPAGVYRVLDRIDIVQDPADPVWNKLTIHGDGKRSSIILRESGGTDGVFNVDFQASATRLNVHNMMLAAGYANAGAAVALREPGASPDRSLHMFNVNMKRVYSVDNYFTTCLTGINLEDPYLENIWISMYKSVNEDEHAVGSAGIYLRGGRGMTADRISISDGLEYGFDVQMNGGILRIKSHSAVQVGGTGCKVDAGGGTVAIEGCHFNCHDINLDIQNAGHVSYVNSLTLTRDGDSVDGRTNTATIRLSGCDCAEIRNNTFSKSHPYKQNSLRKCIWLEGSSNRNVRIVKNRFEEPGETHVYVDSGSVDTDVAYNRFSRTEVDDLEDHGSGTGLTRSYELNGETEQTYLAKNINSGLYLAADGSVVDCSRDTVDSSTQWTVSHQGDGEYTLQNDQTGNLLGRAGDDVDCNTTVVDTDTLWKIVNLEDGRYSLWNASGTTNCLDYDPVGGVDCGEASVANDEQRWEMFLCRDLSTSVFSAGDAALLITCDDSYELYVNGSLVATASQWETAERYVVNLVSGTNVVAVKGVDVAGSAALLAEIVRINAVAGTDASWKVSLSGPDGWQDLDFDDSGWTHATEYGAYGVAPWNTGVDGIPYDTPAKWIWSSDNSGDDTVYFRGTIIVP